MHKYSKEKAYLNEHADEMCIPLCFLVTNMFSLKGFFCADLCFQVKRPKAYNDGHTDIMIYIYSCIFMNQTFYILQPFL